jgi:predicted enzyme related to lactoylglutathione lyase
VLLESAEFSLKQTIQASCVIGIVCTLASNVKRKAARYSNGEKPTTQTPSDTPSGLHFRRNTDYFAPSKKPFMIDLQVENLDEVLAQLKREGVDVDTKVESYDYGKFGWIMDPEVNRVDLWEPKKN